MKETEYLVVSENALEFISKIYELDRIGLVAREDR